MGIIMYPVSNNYLIVWINIGIIMYPVSNSYLIVWINIGITMYPVSNNPLTVESTNWPYKKIGLESFLENPSKIYTISAATEHHCIQKLWADNSKNYKSFNHWRWTSTVKTLHGASPVYHNQRYKLNLNHLPVPNALLNFRINQSNSELWSQGRIIYQHYTILHSPVDELQNES